MKGQMVFEFVVAAALFFGILFYVISNLNATVNTYSSDFAGSGLENKALQVSDFLLHFELTGEWPVLSSAKITAFELSYCDGGPGYVNLLQKLGMENNKIRIQMNETGNSNPVLVCGPDLSSYAKTSIKRFALSDGGKKLIMDVWVW
jgi:hypothetical protein